VDADTTVINGGYIFVHLKFSITMRLMLMVK